MKSKVTPLPSDPSAATREYDPSEPKPEFEMFNPSTTYWFSRPLPPLIDGFDVPVPPPLLTPGATYSVSASDRPTGRRESMTLSRLTPAVAVWVSTTGDAPVTWTVSVSPPTCIVNGRSTV